MSGKGLEGEPSIPTESGPERIEPREHYAVTPFGRRLG
jgi:hypothetical protein